MATARKTSAAAAKTAAKKAAPAAKRAAKKTTASKTAAPTAAKTKGDDSPVVNTNASAPNSPPVQSNSPDPTLASAPVYAGVGAAPHYDDDDVPAALARKTHDGSGLKGDDGPPESDFAGYATQGVEKDDK